MSQALSNLAVGSKVKFGSYSVNGETAQPIVWTIVAKNHTGYPSNSVTLHTSEIIDIRCIDEKEPNNSNSDRQEYGNSRYSVSNLDQWLNKDSAAGKWYVAAHDADQAPDLDSTVERKRPYAERPGFLNAFTQVEKDAILSTTIQATGQNIDNSQYETIERKVFLPSYTEIGLSGYAYAPIEGSTWGYYTDNASRVAYLTQQSFNAIPGYISTITSPLSWWLRTVIYDDIHFGSTQISSTGKSAYTGPIATSGIRPALNLSNTLKVSDSTDSDGCYTFTWPSHPMPWVGGTETYTENETRNVEVSLGDLKEADYADELVSYTVKGGEQTSFGIGIGVSNTGNYCRLEAQGALASGATESCSLTFTKALTGVTIKCKWEGYATDTDVTDTITCYFKGDVVFEKTGTSASHTTDIYTLDSVAEGNVVTVSFTRSGTTTKSNGKIREGYTLYFSSNPITITETVQVQKTRGINKPVSSIYAGVTATVPVYTETTTTEDIALSSATFTDFFSADSTGTTGTNAKGITWTNTSGGGLKLKFGNYGINSSTSMTTFTAQRDLTNVVIKGLYYTESNFDKITLTVAGTTVLNAVSGTSSTLTQRWAGSLSKGQTIVLKYVKDSSQSAGSESSTYFTLSCDPYQKTTVNKTQTGTETKLVDKKIVKGYVGGPDGKARLFFGNNGLIASFDGNYTSEMINVDGVSYELCTLTSSGVLKLNKTANVWICGGGSDGSSTSSAGGCGGNIGQTIIEDTSVNYIITIGASGTASTVETEDGTTVISAGGGTTEAGGCGRGGYKYATTSSASTEEYVPNGATDTHPFGLTQLDPCCAGAGSGSLKYKTSNRYKGGNGGSSGISPTSVTTLASGTKLTINDAALGGAKGGGNGGVAESNGSYLIQATSGTYYGAGGGGPWCTTNTKGTLQKNYGTPGSGYQGVVMLFEKLDAAAHQHIAGTEGHVTVSPTCNSTGTVVYYCTECGEVASTKNLPALGHYYESNGDGTKSCIRCGLTVRE